MLKSKYLENENLENSLSQKMQGDHHKNLEGFPSRFGSVWVNKSRIHVKLEIQEVYDGPFLGVSLPKLNLIANPLSTNRWGIINEKDGISMGTLDF
jgi:hypothetical protein